MTLDLPLIWAGIIAIAVVFYVILDGFVLGIGILFPFARDDADQDRMLASVKPFWDGNQTWLVLGGGGLLVAFPRGYSVLMPAFYYLAEVLRWRMTWLVTLGRTALVLYFIHQLIVLTLINQRLGLRTNDWPWYLGANLVLLVALLGIGKLWLTVKARIFVNGWRLQYRRTSP